MLTLLGFQLSLNNKLINKKFIIKCNMQKVFKTITEVTDKKEY